MAKTSESNQSESQPAATGQPDPRHAGGPPAEADPKSPPKSADAVRPTASESSQDDGLRSRIEHQALLIEANAFLAGAIDAQVVLVQILTGLAKRARLAHASIFLLDEEKQLLRLVADFGYETKKENRELPVAGPGMVPYVARTVEPLYVSDVTRDARYLCGHPDVRAEYAVPLRSSRKVLGVLNVESVEADGIRSVTRRLIDQIAAPAALALERSELYRKLRASEERFRSIFEQNQFGVTLSDLEGRIFAANKVVARSLGYEPEELLGKSLCEILHAEDREKTQLAVRKLLANEIPHFWQETRFIRKDGGVCWRISTASIIRDAAGEPAYFLLMGRDITEEKKANEERTQLQKQLVMAQKMEAIGTLAGGLAHDFNNFLGVILGFASLVRNRLGSSDPLQEPVGMIERSAREAAELTRALLGLTRHEEPHREPVDLKAVVESVIKIVRRTFDRRIHVEAQIASDPAWVRGDPTQLEQAILNLCLNARDAMPERGQLSLEVSNAELGREDRLLPPQHPPGRYVRIDVKDTGTGVDPSLLPHVFEAFFTTKGSTEGSGLGLAMVHAIVESHRGFLEVDSGVGWGSRFSLFIPAVESRKELKAGPPEKWDRIEEGSGTVLVVDDEPMVRAFAEQGLEKLGYIVLTAESGRRACEIYASPARRIDCVLLDLVMPDMSGIETYRKLLEIDPHVRVILSSGYSERAVAREVLDLGAAGFLDKPYTLEALSHAIKKAH